MRYLAGAWEHALRAGTQERGIQVSSGGRDYAAVFPKHNMHSAEQTATCGLTVKVAARNVAQPAQSLCKEHRCLCRRIAFFLARGQTVREPYEFAY